MHPNKDKIPITIFASDPHEYILKKEVDIHTTVKELLRDIISKRKYKTDIMITYIGSDKNERDKCRKYNYTTYMNIKDYTIESLGLCSEPKYSVNRGEETYQYDSPIIYLSSPQRMSYPLTPLTDGGHRTRKQRKQRKQRKTRKH